MENNPAFKICSTCKEELKLIYFHKNKHKKDGFSYSCKECRKKDSIKNKDKISKYKKEYRENKKEYIRESKKKYYCDNKEKLTIKNKTYNELNKEKIALAQKKYYNKNKEIIKIKAKEYYNSEKGKVVYKKARIKRKALIRNATTGNVDLSKIISNKRCYWCNSKILDDKYHIDHYMPISKGGIHNNDNLVLSCPKCNLIKGAKDPFIFANSIGRLL